MLSDSAVWGCQIWSCQPAVGAVLSRGKQRKNISHSVLQIPKFSGVSSQRRLRKVLLVGFPWGHLVGHWDQSAELDGPLAWCGSQALAVLLLADTWNCMSECVSVVASKRQSARLILSAWQSARGQTLLPCSDWVTQNGTERFLNIPGDHWLLTVFTH